MRPSHKSCVLLATVVGAGLIIFACSSSDENPPAGTGGSAGKADASTGGTGGGTSGAAGTGGSAGTAGTGGVAGAGGTAQGGAAGAGGTAQGGAAGEGGSAGEAGASGTAGNGGSAGGAAGGAAGSSGAAGTAGTAGSAGSDGCGNAQSTTVETIAGNTLPDMSYVSVTGAIATTAKLVITNACLFGVYVKDPSANAGAMLISQGTKQGTTCQATDALPTVQPGDILDFKGRITHFLPTNCSGVPQVIELSVENVEGCSATKTGSGTAPAPLEATPADLMAGKYGNLLVKVTSVTAQDWPDGGVLDSVGTLLLAGSGLQVKDSLYYRFQGMPVFSSGQVFNQIVGINAFPSLVGTTCSWALAPRDKCTDFDPKSGGCP
jgi:hypothetical protein